MLCNDLGVCNDLSYCQGKNAVLHIGQSYTDIGITDGAEIRVLFTNRTTGAVTALDIDTEQLPSIDLDTEGFTPIKGHSYLVQLVLESSGGGIMPIQVKPYEWSDGSYDVSSTGYDGLLVRFTRVFTQTDSTTASVDSATEQWMTLK